MMDKRGFELSVNFLVVIIISIAVIGFGIRFVYKLVAETSELQKVSGEELDEKIGDLLCADEQRVCVGIERKKIPRGKADVFGVKILNILPPPSSSDPLGTRNFDVYVQIPSTCGVDKSGAAISDGNCEKIKVIHGSSGDASPATSGLYTITTTGYSNSYKRTLQVPSKQEKTIAIAFEVPKGLSKSGTYIFNVRVREGNPSQDYTSTKKIYVEVP